MCRRTITCMILAVVSLCSGGACAPGGTPSGSPPHDSVLGDVPVPDGEPDPAAPSPAPARAPLRERGGDDARATGRLVAARPVVVDVYDPSQVRTFELTF